MAKTMRASEFKAKCLEAMDEVASSGEPVVITKRGKPVAQLAPIARQTEDATRLPEGAGEDGR